MREFCIEASDFVLRASGDCPETLGTIQRYLLPWLPRTSGPCPKADLCFSITRQAVPGHCEVRLNDRVIAASEALPYLLNVIQQAVDNHMIHHLDRKAVVHAGCVAYRGRAIVLPGSSGAGKSRIVQELLRQGADYCSDEYAIVDALGNIHPYPRALMIRKEGDEQYPMLATEMNATVRSQPAPVGLFLFLRYDANAKSLDIAPLDRSEALIRLLQNSPQVLAETPEVLELLKAGVSRGHCYAGVRGDAAEAAAAILRMAETAE